MSNTNTGKYWGVVEGFYGMPWNARQRHQLFQASRDCGLNCYLYAPKDDLKHRFQWRQLYDESQSAEIAALVRDCHRHGLRFVYGLGPGFDIDFSVPAEVGHIINKFSQLWQFGCRDFALLFDDIPPEKIYAGPDGSAAAAKAQAEVANKVHSWLRQQTENSTLFFCPTEYCDAMARPSVAGSKYLAGIAEHLAKEIHVLWTGPAIISEKLSETLIREAIRAFQHPVVIWDNLYANDYDSGRMFLGPYAGRSDDLRDSVSGILINPNCQFETNYMAVRSFGQFVRRGEMGTVTGFDEIMKQWLPSFNSDPEFPLELDDLRFLCEIFYLPYADGPAAQACFERLWAVSAHQNEPGRSPALEQVLSFCKKVREFLDKFVRIRNRELLFAFYHRLWDLREETQYIENLVKQHSGPSDNSVNPALYHPRLFRASLVARLRSAVPFNESRG